MRAQLARPANTVLGPDAYNQFFTMHGTTMMFLFAVPVMQAAGLYLVPLMIGARNVAFPQAQRLRLLGVPVRRPVPVRDVLPQHRAGYRLVQLRAACRAPSSRRGSASDVWAQSITFTEIAALAAAVELIVTIFKMRAPGMTLNRMPLFVWAMLIQSFMVLFAMPWVATASQFLAMDRLVATHFFNQAEGGGPLLWQHLFWFFGHPEVYIIFVPALGFVSSIVATFTRRPIFGYPAMVLSLIAHGVPGLRAVGAPHVRDRPPAARRELLHRREHDDRHPQRDPDLLLDRHPVGGAAAAHGALALGARFRGRVHHRGVHRGDDRLGAVRSAGPRHVLHRGAPALRADRRRRLPAVRRVLLLVPQSHRPAAGRAPGALAVRAVLRRGEPHLLPDAPARPGGDAAAGLHVPSRGRLGQPQSARDRSARRCWRRACCSSW